MNIDRLNQDDKLEISQWRYSGEYASFNYALEANGWIDKYCCDTDSHCFGVRDQGTLIGVFMFIEKYENEFRVLIHPNYLSQGYGKRVTNEALKTGFELLKLEKISLIVRKNHPVAIKLYEKLGFIRVGETTQTLQGEEIEFYTMLKMSL